MTFYSKTNWSYLFIFVFYSVFLIIQAYIGDFITPYYLLCNILFLLSLLIMTIKLTMTIDDKKLTYRRTFMAVPLQKQKVISFHDIQWIHIKNRYGIRMKLKNKATIRLNFYKYEAKLMDYLEHLCDQQQIEFTKSKEFLLFEKGEKLKQQSIQFEKEYRGK